MDRRDRIDAFGASALIGFAVLFAINQVVIKLTNGGFQPVFQTGLRSLLAVPVLLLWMRYRGYSLKIEPGTTTAGLLVGALFAAEFICLFTALDLTSVARSSVIFYSMPVWLSLGAHYLLPGERLTAVRALGLGLAFAGVALAILDRDGADGATSLLGDLAALGAALGWAGIALTLRASALGRARPEKQLLWQLVISIPILLLAAPSFGPFLREPTLWHVAGLGFQVVAVVTFGFIGWLWLLARYPASGVASFSFLTPVIGVGLGWGLLGEDIAPSLLMALGLVAVGIVLINRRPRPQATSRTSAQTGK